VTFGRPEASWPALLKDRIEKKLGRPLEVMNFGVPGYSSWQGRQLSERVLKEYRPDLVIILYGWNDHWLAKGFSDKDQIVSLGKAPALLSLLRRLRLYQFLNHELAWLREKIAPPARVLRVSPEDYSKNLEAMIKMSQAAGARPILATAASAIKLGQVPEFMTYLEFIRAPGDLSKLHDEYNRIVREVAKKNAVPLADLDAVFQEKDLPSLFAHPDQDVIHPNQKGYQLLAEALAQTLIVEIKAMKKAGPQGKGK